MKKCNEVMTRNPFCCVPDDHVDKVAQLMKSKQIGSIPVVESEGINKLVGIVTDRDLALKIVAESRDPQTATVRDVMSRKVVTCRTDDDVRKAMDAMSKHQLRRIPVVDKENYIVGIIAQADVATRVNDAGRTAAVVKQISQ
jgi:CBS domain-containing protein